MRVANSLTLPVPIPIQLHLTVDVPVRACAAGLVVLSMFFCALLPALGATRRSVTPALKLEEPKYIHRKLTARSAMLTAQVTFSTLLLVIALLFVRNLARTQLTSPGFDTERTVVAQLGFPQRQSGPDNVRLLERAVERVATMPGVVSAAYTADIPLTTHSGSRNGRFAHIGARPDAQHIEYAEGRVGPGYFGAMGIRLVQGREFLGSDRDGAPAVAVVNEEFARRYMKGEAAVGNRIRSGEGRGLLDFEIVGVVANSKHQTIGEEQRAAIYFPLAQRTGGVSLAFIVVRTAANPAGLETPVAKAVGEIDRAVSVEVQPMRDALAFAIMPSQVGAVLLGTMGALGLILAAFGLYAIVAYNVSRRVSEIAIRSALGATRGRILGLVVRDIAVIVGIGVAFGLAFAAVLTKPLDTFLVAGLSTMDPLTFAATAGVFGLVSVLAGWLPARSATRVSPVVAMRAE